MGVVRGSSVYVLACGGAVNEEHPDVGVFALYCQGFKQELTCLCLIEACELMSTWSQLGIQFIPDNYLSGT